MAVSTSTIIVMFISALLVLLMPFTTLLFGMKHKDSRISGFFPGMLGFLIALTIFGLFWKLFGMEGIITALLGDDFTVKKIRITIYYLLFTVVKCLIFYWIVRQMCNKYKEDKPFRAIRYAGGYTLTEACIFVLPYIVLPLIVILTNGKTEFHVFEQFTLENVKNVELFDLFLKVFMRFANVIVYVVALFSMYTARKYEAKWLYAIAPIIMLAVELPYQYAGTNSRKLSDSSVVEIDVFWRNENNVVIATGIVIVITLIISKVIYNNYYRTAEKTAAIKAKRQAKRERLKSLFNKKSADTEDEKEQ